MLTVIPRVTTKEKTEKYEEKKEKVIKMVHQKKKQSQKKTVMEELRNKTGIRHRK